MILWGWIVGDKRPPKAGTWIVKKFLGKHCGWPKFLVTIPCNDTPPQMAGVPISHDYRMVGGSWMLLCRAGESQGGQKRDRFKQCEDVNESLLRGQGQEPSRMASPKSPSRVWPQTTTALPVVEDGIWLLHMCWQYEAMYLYIGICILYICIYVYIYCTYIYVRQLNAVQDNVILCHIYMDPACIHKYSIYITCGCLWCIHQQPLVKSIPWWARSLWKRVCGWKSGSSQNRRMTPSCRWCYNWIMNFSTNWLV